ncbi:MAG: protein translocase subunit secA, partial [Bryobacterales bacterium]|nr:protein translocase subunit secA [Bryobacterales bacterium]
SSRFYLSLQDDLLRIFGGERMQNLMLRLGMEEDVPIESNLITKRIAAAQQAVEVQNFESRKHLLEYDDVMNKQRTAVYKMRRDSLEGLDQKEHVLEMTRGSVGAYIDIRCPEGTHPDKFDISSLRTDIQNQFGHKIDGTDFAGMSREEIEDTIYDQLVHKYQQKEDLIGADIMRQTERMIILQVVDDQWKDHLLSMDHLKEGIGLRGYGQKDPLVEYKKESFALFQDMMDRIEDETLRILYTFTFEAGRPDLPFEPGDDEEYEVENGNGSLPQPAASEQERQAAQAAVQDFTKKIERNKDREMAQLQFIGGDGASASAEPVVKGDKTGRNDPCPCGSGKKYKKCHGA